MAPVKRIEIHSGTPIAPEKLKMIQDIFRESQCPNESLSNSIDDFAFYNGYIIQLNSGDQYKAFVEV